MLGNLQQAKKITGCVQWKTEQCLEELISKFLVYKQLDL